MQLPSPDKELPRGGGRRAIPQGVVGVDPLPRAINNRQLAGRQCPVVLVRTRLSMHLIFLCTVRARPNRKVIVITVLFGVCVARGFVCSFVCFCRFCLMCCPFCVRSVRVVRL
jgi:hypothetical protein